MAYARFIPICGFPNILEHTLCVRRGSTVQTTPITNSVFQSSLSHLYVSPILKDLGA